MVKGVLCCVLVFAVCACGGSDNRRRHGGDDDAGDTGNESGGTGGEGTGSGGLSASGGDGAQAGKGGGSSGSGVGGSSEGGLGSGATGGGVAANGGTGASAGQSGTSGSAGGPPVIECDLEPFLEDRTTLEFDVTHAAVSGEVTLAGATVPDSPDIPTRGIVRFADLSGASSYGFSVGSTGVATFSGRVFAGVYDATFEGASDSALMGLPIGQFARMGDAVEIAGDVNLPYDLRLATVSGTITLNGGALPDSSEIASRGYVTFTNTSTNKARSFSVGPTGLGSYGGVVFAGEYDITFLSEDEPSLIGLPRDNRTMLAKGVAITADQAADYDLKTVSIAGTVTAAGAPMPDSPEITSRGGLWFMDRDTRSYYYASVGSAGAADYDVFMFSGTYDVTFESASDSGLVGLPRDATAPVMSQGLIDSDRNIDFDVKPVSVAGTLTVNGAAMPDSPDAAVRGNVSFRDLQTNTNYSFSVGPTGPASFSGLLFAGDYVVTFNTTDDAALLGLPRSRSKQVASTLAVTEAATLSYDVMPVTVSGALTLGGAAMLDSPDVDTRGSVRFTDLDSGESYTFDVGNAGPANYSGTVFASDYAVVFDSASSGPLVGLPIASTARITGRVPVTSDQSGDYDIRVVNVSGTLTANGAVLPDSPELDSRGHLSFTDKLTNESRSLSVGNVGPGAFSGLLFAGAYDVAFTTEQGSALIGLPIGALTKVATGCVPTALCKEPIDDLSGFWTFHFSSGGFGTITAQLTQTGESLTGPLSAPAFPLTAVFYEGRVSGNDVFLRATFPGGSCNPFEITATLSGACSMTGKVYCGGYGSTPTVVGFR